MNATINTNIINMIETDMVDTIMRDININDIDESEMIAGVLGDNT